MKGAKLLSWYFKRKPLIIPQKYEKIQTCIIWLWVTAFSGHLYVFIAKVKNKHIND